VLIAVRTRVLKLLPRQKKPFEVMPPGKECLIDYCFTFVFLSVNEESWWQVSCSVSCVLQPCWREFLCIIPETIVSHTRFIAVQIHGVLGKNK